MKMKFIGCMKSQFAIRDFVSYPMRFIRPSFKIRIRSNRSNVDGRRDFFYPVTNAFVIVFNDSLIWISVEVGSYVGSVRI